MFGRSTDIPGCDGIEDSHDMIRRTKLETQAIA